MRHTDVVRELDKKSSKKKAESSSRFFKTEPGQYGHGDIIRGVTVPEMRLIAKQFQALSLLEVAELLRSKIHEHRYTALLIMVSAYEKSSEKIRQNIVDLYLSNLKYVNNWDLVDTSASCILGQHLNSKKRTVLRKLAKSESMWKRRVAIVSTYHFIKQNDLKDTLEISKLLLKDSEDLIHKAVGWMLREVGKKDVKVLKHFLDKYIKIMPRTTLRYAIERFPESERQHYLKSK